MVRAFLFQEEVYSSLFGRQNWMSIPYIISFLINRCF